MQHILNNNNRSDNYDSSTTAEEEEGVKTKEQEDSELLEIFAADILKKFSEWLNQEYDFSANYSNIENPYVSGRMITANVIRNKLIELSMGWIDSAYNVREAYGPNETKRRLYKPGSGQFENLT